MSGPASVHTCRVSECCVSWLNISIVYRCLVDDRSSFLSWQNCDRRPFRMLNACGYEKNCDFYHCLRNDINVKKLQFYNSVRGPSFVTCKMAEISFDNSGQP